MRGIDGVKLKASDIALDFEVWIAPCGHDRGHNMYKIMGHKKYNVIQKKGWIHIDMQSRTWYL